VVRSRACGLHGKFPGRAELLVDDFAKDHPIAAGGSPAGAHREEGDGGFNLGSIVISSPRKGREEEIPSPHPASHSGS